MHVGLVLLYLLYLKCNDAEQDADGRRDLKSEKNSQARADLTDEIDEDKDISEKSTAVPRGVDVVSLIGPLEPHANSILQERRYEAQTSQMRQNVLETTQHVVGDVFASRNQRIRLYSVHFLKSHGCRNDVKGTSALHCSNSRI